MNLPSTSINFSNCGIAEDTLLNTIIVCSSDHPPSTRGNALPTMSAIKLDEEVAARLSRKRSRNRFHMSWKIPPPTGREDSRDDANDKPPKRKPKTTNTQVSLADTTSKLTSDIARKEDTLVSEEIEHKSDMDSRVVSLSPRRSRNRALSEDEFEHQIFPTLVLPSLSK